MSWNEPYKISNSVDIMGVQRVVTTPSRYMPGQGDLTVYYNGLYAIQGKDYVELTPYSIEFLYDVEEGDTVVFHHQKLW